MTSLSGNRFANGQLDCSDNTKFAPVYMNSTSYVLYSYSVTWTMDPNGARSDDLRGRARRFRIRDYLTLIQSCTVIFLLSLVVGALTLKRVRSESQAHSSSSSSSSSFSMANKSIRHRVVIEELTEEVGWKLVHGDVFRLPSNAACLSALVGSGLQIMASIGAVFLLALSGLLSSSDSSAWLAATTEFPFLNAAVISYLFFSCLSGYSSAVYYKMVGGKRVRRSILLSASLVPCAALALYAFLNVALRMQGSNNALPVLSFLVLLLLFTVIHIPLFLYGYYRGYKRDRVAHPVRTNQIPRQIPRQPLYSQLLPLFGGLLPFASIFVQLGYIYHAMWDEGDLVMNLWMTAISYTMLILTCSHESILLSYDTLRRENYRWVWRSFISTASTGLYCLGYSLYYWFAMRPHLELGLNGWEYWTWCVIFALTVSLVTGKSQHHMKCTQ